MSDPIAFGDDVVDGVDDILAAHVNNLRAWAMMSSFIPPNINTADMTTDLALSDTDLVVQFLNLDGAARNAWLPAAAATNHPYIIANTSTDAQTLTVMNSSSDTIVTIAQAEARMILSNAVIWRAIT